MSGPMSQRAVGTKPLIVGRALKVLSLSFHPPGKVLANSIFFLQVTYHSSQHYMEVDIDMAAAPSPTTSSDSLVRLFSKSLARHFSSLVTCSGDRQICCTLVVDMCFLIEGKRVDELPVRALHPLNRYITNDFIFRND